MLGSIPTQISRVNLPALLRGQRSGSPGRPDVDEPSATRRRGTTRAEKITYCLVRRA